MEMELGLAVTFQHTKDAVKYDPQVTIRDVKGDVVLFTFEDIRKLPKVDDAQSTAHPLVREAVRIIKEAKRPRIEERTSSSSPAFVSKENQQVNPTVGGSLTTGQKQAAASSAPPPPIASSPMNIKPASGLRSFDAEEMAPLQMKMMDGPTSNLSASTSMRDSKTVDPVKTMSGPIPSLAKDFETSMRAPIVNPVAKEQVVKSMPPISAAVKVETAKPSLVIEDMDF